MRRRPLDVRTNIDKQMNKQTDKAILGCWTVSDFVHMGLHIVGSIVQRAIGEGEANSAQKGSYVALLCCESNIVCFLALRSCEKSAESKHEALYTQKKGHTNFEHTK